MQLITSIDPGERLKGIQKSRLADLIEDKGLFGRVCEAAAMLLTGDKIRACDPETILGSLYKAATLGFRLEPEFGECYLIPRNVKSGDKWVSVCCFQIGYKGWKALALQSGHISYLQAREVYGEDEFSFEQGTSSSLKHVPADENSGVTKLFYAIAKLADGNYIFEVINKQASEKSRKNSESQYDWIGDGKGKQKRFSEQPKDIWAKHYAQMALRVPIKKLCSALPLTPAIEAANLEDGAVTYLQQDGTVTTISPVDVEKNADATPVEDISGMVSPDKAGEYMDVKDALLSMDNFVDVLEYWNDFSGIPLAKLRVFVCLFFEQAALTATTVDQLREFYSSAIAWAKDTELQKVLFEKSTKIKEHAKSNS